MKLFIMQFLQSRVPFFLFCPTAPCYCTPSNSTLLLYTLSLCSSLSVRDQVSHPYKITGKILYLYILSLSLLIANGKAEDSDSRYSLNLTCS